MHKDFWLGYQSISFQDYWIRYENISMFKLGYEIFSCAKLSSALAPRIKKDSSLNGSGCKVMGGSSLVFSSCGKAVSKFELCSDLLGRYFLRNIVAL